MRKDGAACRRNRYLSGSRPRPSIIPAQPCRTARHLAKPEYRSAGRAMVTSIRDAIVAGAIFTAIALRKISVTDDRMIATSLTAVTPLLCQCQPLTEKMDVGICLAACLASAKPAAMMASGSAFPSATKGSKPACRSALVRSPSRYVMNFSTSWFVFAPLSKCTPTAGRMTPSNRLPKSMLSPMSA